MDSYQEEDDGGFFDQLKRQILQLTDEDDDYVHQDRKARKLGSLHGPLCFYDWPGIKEDCTATTPAWMLNLWRSGNGTGVFIPQTLHFTAKNRSRRKNERGRTYKRVER